MSQKTDNMIKLALVFFVTLLSFSIGTYVGKKYSDNQHKLALLEPKKETPATAKTDEFASEATEGTEAHGLIENENPQDNQKSAELNSQKPAALSDSEVAKIAEEFATEVEASEKLVATIDPQETELKTIPETSTVKVLTKPTANLTAKLVANPITKSAAQTVVHKAIPVEKTKPTEGTAENRIPASINTKKDIIPLLYTVQIGSYSTLTEAEQITQDLQGKGFKTSFVPANINGQTWYRVNVGLFGTIKEAQEYKKEFLIKTKLSSAIVQRVLQ